MGPECTLDHHSSSNQLSWGSAPLVSSILGCLWVSYTQMPNLFYVMNGADGVSPPNGHYLLRLLTPFHLISHISDAGWLLTLLWLSRNSKRKSSHSGRHGVLCERTLCNFSVLRYYEFRIREDVGTFILRGLNSPIIRIPYQHIYRYRYPVTCVSINSDLTNLCSCAEKSVRSTSIIIIDVRTFYRCTNIHHVEVQRRWDIADQPTDTQDAETIVTNQRGDNQGWPRVDANGHPEITP